MTEQLMQEPPAPGHSGDWRDQAECASFYAQTGYDAWYGPDEEDGAYIGGQIDKEHRDWARRICAECPVKAQCLEFALTDDAGWYGIWAGLMPNEVRQLKRERIGKAA